MEDLTPKTSSEPVTSLGDLNFKLQGIRVVVNLKCCTSDCSFRQVIDESASTTHLMTRYRYHVYSTSPMIGVTSETGSFANNSKG